MEKTALLQSISEATTAEELKQLFVHVVETDDNEITQAFYNKVTSIIQTVEDVDSFTEFNELIYTGLCVGDVIDDDQLENLEQVFTGQLKSVIAKADLKKLNALKDLIESIEEEDVEKTFLNQFKTAILTAISESNDVAALKAIAEEIANANYDFNKDDQNELAQAFLVKLKAVIELTKDPAIMLSIKELVDDESLGFYNFSLTSERDTEATDAITAQVKTIIKENNAAALTDNSSFKKLVDEIEDDDVTQAFEEKTETAQ